MATKLAVPPVPVVGREEEGRAASRGATEAPSGPAALARRARPTGAVRLPRRPRAPPTDAREEAPALGLELGTRAEPARAPAGPALLKRRPLPGAPRPAMRAAIKAGKVRAVQVVALAGLTSTRSSGRKVPVTRGPSFGRDAPKGFQRLPGELPASPRQGLPPRQPLEIEALARPVGPRPDGPRPLPFPAQGAHRCAGRGPPLAVSELGVERAETGAKPRVPRPRGPSEGPALARSCASAPSRAYQPRPPISGPTSAGRRRPAVLAGAWRDTTLRPSDKARAAASALRRPRPPRALDPAKRVAARCRCHVHP